MAIESKLRRWGNSMGVIIPNEFIRSKNLKENEIVFLEVVVKSDLTPITNLVKERKMSGQEAKNLARKGWKK